MKWWMIGCLMIGPVSLQAQVSSGKITEALVSGKQVWLVADSGRLFFGGLPANGLLADKVSFGSFFFNRLSKDGRSNDNLLQRTAPSPASSLPPSPACLMTSHAYYDQHFGFFCKKEWVWQKQTGIPVKVRLGSYDLTQRQEGK
nr:hypothetical protein [uncultured Chitinophaga sp.]